jgi:hypothetical protein
MSIFDALPQLPADAANHFVYGAVGFVGMDLVLRAQGAPHHEALALAMSGTVLLAVLKKVIDLADHVAGYTIDWKDWALDIGAQVAGGALFLLVQV